MVDRLFDKGFAYLARKLTAQIHYHAADELLARMRHFKVKRFAVLVDGKTDLTALEAPGDITCAGYYSFSLDMIGGHVNGSEVIPLSNNAPAPDVDAWVISAVNEFAGDALSRYLLEHDREGQVILYHAKPPAGTAYYSYIDFFSDEQMTTIQLHNYFERVYHIPFPLPLRYTLRNEKGAVLAAGQVIVPPGGIRVIASSDFAATNFRGYLEIEFEVAHKVMPFLHYYATYASVDFISNNHQSGLGLHPAGAAFTRGYVPVASDETLVVCLFQRHYSDPVQAKAILRYCEQGTGREVIKDFPPLGKNQMLFQDIKALFNEIDFTVVESPQVIVRAEVPIHRPNYYYAKRGKKGYYDTSHAGPDPKQYAKSLGGASLTEPERTKMRKLGCADMELAQVIMPPDTHIETLLGLGNDTTTDILRFVFDFYDRAGRLMHSFEDTFDHAKGIYLNITAYLEKKGIRNFAGVLSLRAAANAAAVPVVMNGISAYRHRDNPYITSTAASGSAIDNIPFYFRAGPPNYLGGDCAAGVTDIFGPGIASDEYDTYYTVIYPSADRAFVKQIRYEIQVVNVAGEKRMIYRSIAAHGADIFLLSDLVREASFASAGGYYIVWFFSAEAHLYAQRILVRRRDRAISVEHCYVGKYGV